MRKVKRRGSELEGSLRLVVIAIVGSFFAFVWLLRTAEGSWSEHLVAAFLLASAPLVFAFPRLFRARRTDLLSRLRASGAI
jgi:predicted membrane-bound mannosyltransferase